MTIDQWLTEDSSKSFPTLTHKIIDFVEKEEIPSYETEISNIRRFIQAWDHNLPPSDCQLYQILKDQIREVHNTFDFFCVSARFLTYGIPALLNPCLQIWRDSNSDQDGLFTFKLCYPDFIEERYQDPDMNENIKQVIELDRQLRQQKLKFEQVWNSSQSSMQLIKLSEMPSFLQNTKQTTKYTAQNLDTWKHIVHDIWGYKVDQMIYFPGQSEMYQSLKEILDTCSPGLLQEYLTVSLDLSVSKMITHLDAIHADRSNQLAESMEKYLGLDLGRICTFSKCDIAPNRKMAVKLVECFRDEAIRFVIERFSFETTRALVPQLEKLPFKIHSPELDEWPDLTITQNQSPETFLDLIFKINQRNFEIKSKNSGQLLQPNQFPWDYSVSPMSQYARSTVPMYLPMGIFDVPDAVVSDLPSLIGWVTHSISWCLWSNYCISKCRHDGINLLDFGIISKWAEEDLSKMNALHQEVANITGIKDIKDHQTVRYMSNLLSIKLAYQVLDQMSPYDVHMKIDSQYTPKERLGRSLVKRSQKNNPNGCQFWNSHSQELDQVFHRECVLDLVDHYLPKNTHTQISEADKMDAHLTWSQTY